MHPHRSLLVLLLIVSPACDNGGSKPVDAAADITPDTRPRCDPSSCPQGCCAADGQCVTSATSSACGKSGGRCLDCAAAGGSCTATGAYCELPACDKTTCPTGCCENKLCWTGASDAVCGTGGDPCADCSLGGQLCQEQSCSGTPTCDATSCAGGCCRGGQCLAGTSDLACGSGGAVCLDCTGSGQKCGAQQACQ